MNETKIILALSKADEYQYQAAQYASLRVIELAREILEKHPEFNEFIMGMGGWMFTYKQEVNEEGYINHSEGYDTEVKCLHSFRDFINKYDMRLHITGEPMRFTAKGEMRRQW